VTQPNVIFVLADQHRWDFLGTEGNGVTYTPNLDRLARAGVSFASTYCTAPLCCPSRAAIISGRYAMNTGCFTNLHELPPGTPTFVQQFRAAGYRTCAIGKTHMEIHAYDSDLQSDAHRAYMDSLGWDEICEISGNDMFRHGIRCAYSDFLKARGLLEEAVAFYEQWHYFMDPNDAGDPFFACHEWSLPEDTHQTAFVGERALAWLRSRNGTQPFFLQVGFAGPHSPIDPPPSAMDRYRDAPETAAWGAPSPPSWLADGRRGYRALITQIDDYVGRLFDTVAGQELLENTIFVYMADHGEMAGDHGFYEKSNFFEGAARVPLIVAGPGVDAQPTNAALVETLDIGRTLCDLCGVPAHSLDQGRSLAPILAGETASHRDTLYGEMGCDRMIRDGRYKLMWGDPLADTRKLGRLHLDKPVNIPPSPCRLYDLHADPHELHDLSADLSQHAVFVPLLEKLLVRLNENTQTRPNQPRGEYRPLKGHTTSRTG
jgi:arylsulfatase